MKPLVILIFLLLSKIAISQTWQSMHRNDFGFDFGGWFATTSGTNYGFNISPYDNSIWLLRNEKITYIDPNGTLTEFEQDIDPVLNENGDYKDFAFANNKVYALDKWSGVYSFDGTAWSFEHMLVYGSNFCSDGDTLWVGENGGSGDGVQILNGTMTFLDHGYTNIRTKNGLTWVNNSSSVARYYSGQFAQYYSPDTCILLSTAVETFKFSPNTDSLYVAGDLGISIAHDDMFIDTITQFNTTNMPTGYIKEMEFDADDNIWATFTENGATCTSIGFLDRTTNTWTEYNNNNSPINFPAHSAIELDTNGNLWVANISELHCLQLGTTPDWLATKELNTSKFTMYPNPSDGNVSINLKENTNANEVRVADVSGTILIEESFASNYSWNLPTGIYFVTLFENDVILGTEKLIVK